MRVNQDMANAQRKVRRGNCVYAGACSPQEFVYTPGIYSASNENFVRQTVLDYYERFDPRKNAVDDVCPR